MTVRAHTLWLPVAILAALAPALAALGLWQLQRAEEKRDLQAEYDRRTSEAALQLGTDTRDAQSLRYRRVRARGVYEASYQILIDNRVHRGVPGYYVVTPLKLEGSEARVLVNRGWVALGASRAQLPAVEAPAGAQEIAGVATIPLEKVFTLGAPAVGWQPVWPHLDMQRAASSMPFTVLPVVVLLDADVAHGYTREWARLDAGIALHQGYAFQWFALAALAVVIALLIARRARSARRAVAA